MSSFIESVLVPIGSAFGGTLLGYAISQRSFKNQQNRDLEKTRYLLNHDFSRIFHISIARERRVVEIQNNLTNDVFLAPFLQNRDSLVPLMQDLILTVNFAFWDTIVNNGSLIRLEPTEIQIIQSVHDTIDGTQVNCNNAWQTVANVLDLAVNSNTPIGGRLTMARTNLVQYLPLLFQGYRTIMNMSNAAWTISWMNRNLIAPEGMGRMIVDTHGTFHFE